ncbi:MAG: porin [Azoarcus sp.]|nr:porin [Azoarcus sp.]
MQKKLIALAVAGLVSAPVFAQSNVTIYGIVDAGYSWRGDNVASGVGNRSAVDSGQSAGSRLGFKGVEDLGNGLKAGFVLEQGIAVDTGTSTQGGRTFGRQSFVYLNGGFGTVALGRQYAPHHILGAATDPFGKGTVGEFNNVYVSEVRLDNLAAYVSPNWGGFSFVAGFTMNAVADESRDNENGAVSVTNPLTGGAVALGNIGDVRAWAFQPKYSNGPLMVAFNAHEIKLNGVGIPGVVADGDKVRIYDLMGTYDFGVVKLAGAYGVRRADSIDFSPDGAFGGEDSKQWMVGLTVPVGAAGKVLGSYTRRTTELAVGSDAKSSQWALGYEHALSKRTSLYAAYSDISNNSSAENAGVIASVGDAANTGKGYQRGLSTGVRHSF